MPFAPLCVSSRAWQPKQACGGCLLALPAPWQPAQAAPACAPVEREAGGGMIECRRAPGRSGVAAGAIGPAAAPVGVVAGVAGDAGRSQPFQRCPAWHDRQACCRCAPVRAKPVRLWSNGCDLFPASGGVAGLAIATQLSAMWILAGVARRAGCCNAAEMRAVAVAAGASRPGVAAGQRIVGEGGVIERGAIEPDQPVAAPLVFAVAGLAGPGSRCREFAVKASALGNVAANPTVAGGAFGILRGLLERSVAAVAPTLQPGMRSA